MFSFRYCHYDASRHGMQSSKSVPTFVSLEVDKGLEGVRLTRFTIVIISPRSCLEKYPKPDGDFGWLIRIWTDRFLHQTFCQTSN